MTAYSTQGSKLEFSKQSAFGTASSGTYDDIRPEGTPSIKTAVGEGNMPETVFINPNDVDKPIVYNRAMDDAVTVSTLIRQAATAGETSFTKDAFLAGGYVVTTNNNSTIDTYSTTTSFAAADDNFAVGQCVNVQLDDGTWVPTLIAQYNTGNAIVPAMALPSAASGTSLALNSCDTITPGDTGAITASDLLTIRAFFKAQDTGSDVVYQAQDCAVTSIADLSLEPGEKVNLEFTFGASDLSASTGAMGTNDFRDGTEHRVFNEPWCQFATSASAGGIAAAYHKLMSATFSWGVTAEQIPGMGDSACSNNVQGWMQKNAPAKLTMTLLYDEQKLDDFDGTNPDKYVGIIQPGTSEDSPAFGLFLPKAHITSVTHEPWTENEHRVTIEMTPQPAGLDSATGNTQGNQPWYFCIAADSTDA